MLLVEKFYGIVLPLHIMVVCFLVLNLEDLVLVIG